MKAYKAFISLGMPLLFTAARPEICVLNQSNHFPDSQKTFPESTNVLYSKSFPGARPLWARQEICDSTNLSMRKMFDSQSSFGFEIGHLAHFVHFGYILGSERFCRIKRVFELKCFHSKRAGRAKTYLYGNSLNHKVCLTQKVLWPERIKTLFPDALYLLFTMKVAYKELISLMNPLLLIIL